MTRMRLRYVENSGAAVLAALLQRQKGIVTLDVYKGAIPALCQAIVQNYCQRVGGIVLARRIHVLTQEESDLLAGAFEMEGPCLL